jgi:uncharacterized protein YoxC
MMLLLQSATPPGWVGPVSAISLAIIALAFVVIAVALAMAAKKAAQEISDLNKSLAELKAELSPALAAVQQVSAEGTRLASIVADEAEQLVESTRALREGLTERMANLEALYDVVEEEVEETALDVAVKLRSFRSGLGWFGLVRRLLRGAKGR